jgi:hypothetical protein
MLLNEDLINKWKPVLEHDDLPKIADNHRRYVTAVLLENTERSLAEQTNGRGFLAESPTNSAGTGGFGGAATPAGPVAGYDPILISLIRRAAPNLVAYDICGVQPMTGPTGLIFAMRARYANNGGTEAFYNEANTAFSATNAAGAPTGNNEIVGQGTGNVGTVPTGNSETYNYRAGMSTAFAEGLGSNTTNQFAEMAFSIEKVSVVAQSRALKAEYSTELAQDMRAVHGLDAETELANILQTEILAEINREVIRTINVTASAGATAGTTTPGIFDLDTDSNGRWSVEKFKGLMFHIERESNAIAKTTRRGKGNIILCSSDVAAALQMAGVLDYAPALNSNNGLNPDDTGNTFVGVLNGRFRVYIDPYATSDYLTVGYKGSSAFDAGLFYCPYVPLQMVRATGQDSFQPRIGFKTRYGMVANPFSAGATASNGALVQNSNVYYRRTSVSNLM